jgi:hypothetical protein
LTTKLLYSVRFWRLFKVVEYFQTIIVWLSDSRLATSVKFRNYFLNVFKLWFVFFCSKHFQFHISLVDDKKTENRKPKTEFRNRNQSVNEKINFKSEFEMLIISTFQTQIYYAYQLDMHLLPSFMLLSISNLLYSSLFNRELTFHCICCIKFE